MEWKCKYFETSAKTNCNVDDVYCEIMRQIYESKQKKLAASSTRPGGSNGSGNNCCCVIS